MHTGYPLEMHATELAPGLAPHGAHAHIHDELVILREGRLAVTVAGQTTVIGPGRAHYYIIALGPKQ